MNSLSTDESKILVSAQASSRARFAALGEVLMCLVAANAIIVALRLAGLTPELFGVTGDAQIDARTGLVDGLFVILKFAAMLAIGLTILQRVHGVKPAAVGFSFSGHSLPSLLLRGLVLGSVATLPWLVLMSANSVFGFGEGVAGWQRIADAPLNADFILFALAAMVLIPPIMEESAFRGYVRGRLQLAYGPVGAALLTAIVFVFAHGHLYGADAVLVGTQASFLFASFVLAFDTYRSGSIIPAVVAHALMNLPIDRDATGMFAALAIALVVIIAARRAIGDGYRQLGEDWKTTPRKGNLLIFALTAAVLMIATMLYLPAAVLLIVFSVAGTVLSLRRPRKNGPDQPVEH